MKSEQVNLMTRTDCVTKFLFILTFTTATISGCISNVAAGIPSSTSTPVQSLISPVIIESPNPAFANAQATKDAGQSQLIDLARRSTEVGLDMSKAAISAAASTQDFNRRRKMDMDYQSTVISLNITQANATQRIIAEQTQNARDATSAVQNAAAASTHSANLINLTETARAQVDLDAQGRQTVQAAVALTSYPLTATPLAETQAALLMQQYDREERTFLNRVVAPLIPILIVLDLLLILLFIFVVYRWSLSWSPDPNTARGNAVPGTIIDEVIADNNLQVHQFTPSKLTPIIPLRLLPETIVNIEIVNAANPPFADWIAELDHQLTVEKGLPS